MAFYLAAMRCEPDGTDAWHCDYHPALLPLSFTRCLDVTFSFVVSFEFLSGDKLNLLVIMKSYLAIW